MAQQIINVGTNPNDGTGDTLRGAFIKTDDNFTELYSGKQNTLISGTNIKTINGNSILGSGNLTISGGITGSGTDNYIPRFNGTTALENSIIFDNATNVGVGTASPVDKLDVNGSLRLRGNTPSFTAVNNSGVIDYVPTSIFPTDPQVRIAALGSSTVGASILFQTGINSGSITERMRITPEGYVGIGTSSPTVNLQVEGTIYGERLQTINSFITTNKYEIIANNSDNQSKLIVDLNHSLNDKVFSGNYLVSNVNSAQVLLGIQASGSETIGSSNPQQLYTIGLIQDEKTPVDSSTPVKWIKVYDENLDEHYYINLYL